MGFNPRIYIRCFQKTLIYNNPLVIAITQFKKIIDTYSELPKKTKTISSNIFATKEKIERTKVIINSNVKKESLSSINLLR